MTRFTRGLVVPFFAAFFPAVWYVNRDVASEHHPPTDPTSETVAMALVVALIGAVAVAVVASLVIDRTLRESNAPRLRRVLVPDRRPLAVYAAFVAGLLAWSLAEMVGVGPPVLATVLSPVFFVSVVPLVVLAPLAIHSYPAVIVGLALSAVWLAVLSTLVVAFYGRTLERGRRT